MLVKGQFHSYVELKGQKLFNVSQALVAFFIFIFYRSPRLLQKKIKKQIWVYFCRHGQITTKKVFYKSLIFWLIKLYSLDWTGHLDLAFDCSIVEINRISKKKRCLWYISPLFTQSILLVGCKYIYILGDAFSSPW